MSYKLQVTRNYSQLVTCNFFCTFAFHFKKQLTYEFHNKHKNTDIGRTANV